MTTTEQSFRSLTPYACAKVINVELEALGLPTLPPQMFYQYVNKGYIKSFIAADEKRKVSELDLATWFEGYLERKAKAAATKAEKIAAGLKPKAPAAELPCEQDDEETEPTAEQLAEIDEDVLTAD